MKRLIELLTMIGVVMVVLGGCANSIRAVKKNNEGLLTLRMGMSKTEVMSAMGKPDIYESFQNINEKQTEILLYTAKMERWNYNERRMYPRRN